MKKRVMSLVLVTVILISIIPINLIGGKPDPNVAPRVDVGKDQTIFLDETAVINAEITDDGLPAWGDIFWQWEKISGPGTITLKYKTFRDTKRLVELETTVNFSEVGVYVLELVAYDGSKTGSDTIKVTVNILEVGYTPGDFAVSPTGAAIYSIPLDLPPGTAGMAPDLSLIFNSQGQNGILGECWILGGLSAIERVPKTIDQDGVVGGVNGDYNDQLSLDGKRLILVEGIHMMNNAKYRTEIEEFSEITAKNDSGYLSYFIVKKKSGEILYYGLTKNSQFTHYPYGYHRVITWYISRIEDRLGNYIDFEYSYSDNVGYLKSVKYTGNYKTGLEPYITIEFEYENRNDIIMKNFPGTIQDWWDGRKLPGMMGTINKRLKNVIIKLDSNEIRRYILKYKYDYRNNVPISRLVSIQEKVDTFTFLPATTFEWSNLGTNGFNSSENWLGKYKLVYWDDCWWDQFDNGFKFIRYVGDTNGDGRADIIAFGDDGVYASYSTGYNFTDPEIKLEHMTYNRGGWRPDLHPRMLADINGDGKDDIVGFYYDGVHVAYATYNDFWYSSLQPRLSYFGYDQGWDYTHERELVDVNGDGRADIVGFWGNGVYVSYSTADGYYQTGFDFEDPIYINTGCGNSPDYPAKLADVNGDGMADIVYFGHYGVKVSYSTGNGFTQATFDLIAGYGKGDGWTSEHPRLLADINGDGKADIVGFHDDDVNISFSLGYGFTKPKETFISFGNNDGYDTNRPRMLSDINGDGMADIVGFGMVGVSISCSKGDSFSQAVPILNELGTEVWEIDDIPRMLADANGDGMMDIIAFDWCYVNVACNSLSPGLINSITNGLEKKIYIEYLPLTDSRVYTKVSGTYVYPLVRTCPAIYAVSSVKTSDGIGGLYQIEYKYKNLKANLNGRGFLGFEERKIIDTHTGTVTTENYNQLFPYTGSLAKKEVKTSNGIILSRTINTYRCSSNTYSGGTVYFPYIEKTYTDSQGLDGIWETRTQKKYLDYDNYGNVGTIITEISELLSHNTIDPSTTLKKVSNNTYMNYPNSWILGRLNRSETTHYPTISSGNPSIMRESEFSYYPNGLLKEEIIEPSTPKLTLITSYRYDNYGNEINNTVIGYEVEPRTILTYYDSRGRFANKTINPMGHITKYENNEQLAVIKKIIDPNNRVEQFEYDSLGRVLHHINTDDTEIITQYLWCDNDQDAPTNAVYKIITTSPGSTTVTKYYDMFDRVIRTKKIGLFGKEIFEDIDYDNFARIKKEYQPYFKGQTRKYTEYYYDELGRVITIDPLDHNLIHLKYSRFTINSTKDSGYSEEITKNIAGNVILVKDVTGNITQYEYDAAGNLIKIIDPLNNEINIGYDKSGRRVNLTDPDIGFWQYQYNALGELIWQKDAKGQEKHIFYDLLGRQVKLIEPEGETIWNYDFGAGCKGLLYSIQSPYGSKLFFYDSATGRLVGEGQYIENQWYIWAYIYDSYGRVEYVFYPMKFFNNDGNSPFIIKNIYDENGYLIEVRNNKTAEVYWKVRNANAEGKITGEQLGDKTLFTGYYTYRDYDELGRIEKIISYAYTSSGIKYKQYLNYDYLPTGNLDYRKEYVFSDNGAYIGYLKETFAYDKLNRLVNSTLYDNGNFIDSENYEYNAIGNILYKSGVGTYNYHISKPHAVSNAGGINYLYDANGNLEVIEDDEYQIFQYTSFNKPKRIFWVNSQKEWTFTYDGEKNRIIKNTPTDKTIYVGGLYEKLDKKNGDVDHLYYIYVNGRMIGYVLRQYINGSYQPDEVRFVLTDNLGSIDKVVGINGKIIERLSYDAFGNRRLSNWRDASSIINPDFHYGYTGHEHDDELNLINMKGRLYHPILGRFLTPDIFIQELDNAQSLNRYSYVFNNPLSYTDPTGFFSFNQFLKMALIIGVTIAVTYATAGLASPLGTFAAKIIAGTVGGFVGGLLSSGGDFKQACIGGVMGGAFAFVGASTLFGPVKEVTLERVVAHGFLGGISSVLQGGRFETGFFVGAFSKSVTTDINNAFPTTSFSNAILGTVASAVVGGTLSKMMGGSFSNGAYTASFGYLFNNLMSSWKALWKILSGSPNVRKIKITVEGELKALDSGVTAEISGNLEGEIDAVGEANIAGIYKIDTSGAVGTESGAWEGTISSNGDIEIKIGGGVAIVTGGEVHIVGTINVVTGDVSLALEIGASKGWKLTVCGYDFVDASITGKATIPMVRSNIPAIPRMWQNLCNSMKTLFSIQPMFSHPKTQEDVYFKDIFKDNN